MNLAALTHLLVKLASSDSDHSTGYDMIPNYKDLGMRSPDASILSIRNLTDFSNSIGVLHSHLTNEINATNNGYEYTEEESEEEFVLKTRATGRVRRQHSVATNATSHNSNHTRSESISTLTSNRNMTPEMSTLDMSRTTSTNMNHFSLFGDQGGLTLSQPNSKATTQMSSASDLKRSNLDKYMEQRNVSAEDSQSNFNSRHLLKDVLEQVGTETGNSIPHIGKTDQFSHR